MVPMWHFWDLFRVVEIFLKIRNFPNHQKSNFDVHTWSFWTILDIILEVILEVSRSVPLNKGKYSRTEKWRKNHCFFNVFLEFFLVLASKSMCQNLVQQTEDKNPSLTTSVFETSWVLFENTSHLVPINKETYFCVILNINRPLIDVHKMCTKCVHLFTATYKQNMRKLSKYLSQKCHFWPQNETPLILSTLPIIREIW